MHKNLPTLTNSSMSGSLSSSAAVSIMISKNTLCLFLSTSVCACVCMCLSEFQFTADPTPAPCGEIGLVPLQLCNSVSRGQEVCVRWCVCVGVCVCVSKRECVWERVWICSRGLSGGRNTQTKIASFLRLHREGGVIESINGANIQTKSPMGALPTSYTSDREPGDFDSLGVIILLSDSSAPVRPMLPVFWQQLIVLC